MSGATETPLPADEEGVLSNVLVSVTTSFAPLPAQSGELLSFLTQRGFAQVKRLTQGDSREERALFEARVSRPGYGSLAPRGAEDADISAVLRPLTFHKLNDISADYRQDGFYIQLFPRERILLDRYVWAHGKKASIAQTVYLTVVVWITGDSTTMTLVLAPTSSLTKNKIVRLSHPRGVFIAGDVAQRILKSTASSLGLAQSYRPPAPLPSEMGESLTTILFELYGLLNLASLPLRKQRTRGMFGRSSAGRNSSELLEEKRQEALDTYRTVSFITIVADSPSLIREGPEHDLPAFLTGYTNLHFADPEAFVNTRVVDFITDSSLIAVNGNRLVFAIDSLRSPEWSPKDWMAWGVLCGEIYSHIARVNHEFVQSLRARRVEADSRAAASRSAGDVVRTISALLDFSSIQTPLVHRILTRIRRNEDLDQSLDRIRTIVESRQATLVQRREELLTVMVVLVGIGAVFAPVVAVIYPTISSVGRWGLVAATVAYAGALIGLLAYGFLFMDRRQHRD